MCDLRFSRYQLFLFIALSSWLAFFSPSFLYPPSTITRPFGLLLSSATLSFEELCPPVALDLDPCVLCNDICELFSSCRPLPSAPTPSSFVVPPTPTNQDRSSMQAAAHFLLDGVKPIEVGDVFPSRRALTDAIRLYNFDKQGSSMKEKSDGGGTTVTLMCKHVGCSIEYRCLQNGGTSYVVKKISGCHISCVPPPARIPISLRLIARQPTVSALLCQQTDELGGRAISPKALKRVAAVTHVPLDGTHATRLKLELTRQIEEEGAQECRFLAFFCKEVVRLNKGCWSFLRCRDTVTQELLWMTSSSDDAGVLTVIGSLVGRASSSASLDFVSMYFIPPAALKIFGLRCSTSAADFARMFHKTEVYANLMVFLWNTQFAGTSLALMIGLHVGFECGDMWDYSRSVSRGGLKPDECRGRKISQHIANLATSCLHLFSLSVSTSLTPPFPRLLSPTGLGSSERSGARNSGGTRSAVPLTWPATSRKRSGLPRGMVVGKRASSTSSPPSACWPSRGRTTTWRCATPRCSCT
jgi:hypothetical protein